MKSLAFVRLLPENTKFPFMRLKWFGFITSLSACVISVIALMSFGLNFGIDFKGGVVVEILTKEAPADLAKIRSMMNQLDLGNVEVQGFDDTHKAMIRVQAQQGEGDHAERAQQNAANLVKSTLSQSIKGVEIIRTDVVGPKVSGELIRSGVLAILISLTLMLIYIWIRFEWQFSLGAIIALMHDVLLTMGVFAISRYEFNLSIVAAILTIIGYSMNDTVIVYDRIRENLRKYKKSPMKDILNLSLNETLTRTILTSATTLIALLSLFFLGGQVLRGFSFALIWGVFIGTYSSIFIATPILLFTKFKRQEVKA